jgi:cysteinyl-tRNA synthetase
LSSHYRKPLVFSNQRLEEARMALRRMDACIRTLQEVDTPAGPSADAPSPADDLRERFETAMDDDLNVSAALASLFRSIRKINKKCAARRMDRPTARRLLQAFQDIDGVLGLMDFHDPQLSPEARRWIAEREEARSRKDWKRADRIRSLLASMGVAVRDRKSTAVEREEG